MIRSFLPSRPSEARAHVATARSLAPSDPAPLRGLAAVERYPDRDDRVVEFLTQALELAPEDVATHVALGDVHLALVRVDDAARWARASLEAEPEHTDALVLSPPKAARPWSTCSTRCSRDGHDVALAHERGEASAPAMFTAPATAWASRAAFSDASL
ncbi:hypothetical protein [Sorangium sp. So ce1335]|uniref:hypothetical protein n=1 Tax=Sorangium sp. So ce1335 TaxID=3133335 RepID=UPI003F63D1D3